MTFKPTLHNLSRAIILIFLFVISISSANPVVATEINDQRSESLTEQVRAYEPTTIVQVYDSLGNIQNNSWTDDETGLWSCAPNCPDLDLEIGDVITFTAIADDPNDLPVEYQFSYFRSDGGITIAQEWSTENTFEWHVSLEDVGQNTGINVHVRNNDGQDWQGVYNGDDYTYLWYTVTNPDASPAVIIQVTDSLGNVQTNSWAADGTPFWPCLSSPSGCGNLELEVGDVVQITVTASDPNGLPLEYKFDAIRNGSGPTLQGWSSDNTFEWHVSLEDVGGPFNGILAAVRNNDGEDWFFDAVGDDYTYLFYTINVPDLTPAIILKVTDSLGNINTNSVTKGSGTGWPVDTDLNLDLYVNQTLSFTVDASDPLGLPIQYRFDLAGNEGISIVQDWSTDNTFTWTTTFEDIGPSNGLFFRVKNTDGIDWFGEGAGDDVASNMYTIYYSLIDEIEPTYADEGSSAVTLTINGENFDSYSTVQFGEYYLETELIDSQTLTAIIPETYLQFTGIYPIQVINLNPELLSSNSSTQIDGLSTTYQELFNLSSLSCSQNSSSDIASQTFADSSLTSSNITYFYVGVTQIYLPIMLR